MNKRQPPENPPVPQLSRLQGQFLEIYRRIEMTLERGQVPSVRQIQEEGGYAPTSQFGAIPRKLKELKKLGLIAEPEWRLVGGGCTKLGIAALEQHRHRLQAGEFDAAWKRAKKRAERKAANGAPTKKKAKRSRARK